MIVHYSYFGVGINNTTIFHNDGIGASVVANGFSSKGLRELMRSSWISLLESNPAGVKGYRYYVTATKISDNGKVSFHRAVIDPIKLFI